MRNYLKAGAAVVATVLSAVVFALSGDAVIDPAEWVNVAIAGAGAAAVFTAPNIPGANYTKVVLAAITAVLTLLVSLITDGLSLSEIYQLVIVAFGAVGVYAAPYTFAPASPRHAAAE